MISAAPTPTAIAGKPPIVLTKRTVLVIFGALMASMFLSSLDQSIVSTALPTIVGELNGVAHQGWVITAYMLATATVMPLYGKFGDLWGRRYLFLIAIGLFTVASAAAGFSQTFGELVIWRGIQGLGGGGLMILSQAIIADIVPAKDRGKYMGPMGALFGIAAVIGPLLGGFFTESLDWRWCFWVNIPIGIAAFAVAWKTLKLPTQRSGRKLDVAGIMLMVMATSGLVLTTSWQSWTGNAGFDWTDPGLLALVLGTLLAAVAFVLVEQRAEEPLLPLHLFKNPTFAIATSVGLLTGMGMFAALSFLPQFLQMATGAGVTESGFLMLPMMVGLMGTSIWSGFAISKSGHYRMYPILGMAIATLGLVWLTRLTGGVTMWLFSAMLLVLGAGLGLVIQTIVLAVQNSVDPAEMGTATSASNFFREIGAAVGTTLFSTLYVARLETSLGTVFAGTATGTTGTNSLTPAVVAALPEPLHTGVVDAYANALASTFWYLVPLLAFGFVLTLFLREVKLSDVAGMVARGEAIADHGALIEGNLPQPVEAGQESATAARPARPGGQQDGRGGDRDPDRERVAPNGLN